MRFLGKKYFKYLVPVFLVAAICGFSGLKIVDENIDEILETEDYSYLPSEAKEYIKETYEETGELVLTEKNKIADTPYLNPNYVVYLGASEEEKEQIELIPDAYIIDANLSEQYEESDPLPASYDLRNVGGLNFTTAIKNQGSTALCWAFATIENAETLLMKQNSSETVDDFSVRQLDYATSDDGLAAYAEWEECTGSCSYEAYTNDNNASRSVNTGGNFSIATIAMANAITLTDESVLPWNELDTPKKASVVLGTDKALYEVDSTIVLNSLDANTATTTALTSYVTKIKNYILQYGGPFVGTYAPTSTCAFTNSDGNTVIKTDSCINDSENVDQGHAMQIIGWDDDYEYSYCENGLQHLATQADGTCVTGELATGEGAWILRNSWGSQYQYPYLTYDSIGMQANFITSISSTTDKTWDNNYHINPWTDDGNILYTQAQNLTFHTHNTKNEKIEKIKVYAASQNGSYNISISSGSTNYDNIATLSSTEAGIYTIDLSDQNIIIGEEFLVAITGNNAGSYFLKDTISVFTSNIDESEYVIVYSDEAYNNNLPLSSDNPLYVLGSQTNWNIGLKLYLKNIPETASLTYRIAKASRVTSNFGTSKITIVPEITTAAFRYSSASSADFNYSDEIGTTWVFEIIHNSNVVASFPINFSLPLDSSLNISSSTGAIILSYGSDLTTLSSKLTTRSGGFEHLDGSGNIISSNTLKTGDSIKLDTYEMNDQEFKIVVRGDVDGNGEIGIIDYIRIRKDIMDLSKLSGIYAEAADMNQNNSIDIIDYIRIRKIIMEAQ